MATPNYGVALHAGTCDIWNNDTTYQLEVEKILKEVVEDARTKLRSGETALDIVQGVVTSLEDCPLFNAGKGAVLNEDAEHEVSAFSVSSISQFSFQAPRGAEVRDVCYWLQRVGTLPLSFHWLDHPVPLRCSVVAHNNRLDYSRNH